MSIAQNLSNIKASIPKHITLVAVSKTKPISDLQEAYDAGQRVFGENKIQEMTEKHEVLPKDIEWHMIGHLQSNKIKYMASYVHLIHGVDSLKKLTEINKQAVKHDRVINCLLQVKIAQEDTKFGISFYETKEILNNSKLSELTNIKIIGLMGMASFVDNERQIEKEFANLKQFFDDLQVHYPSIKTLSMGMSGDYNLAINEGSTMIRVGSAIFGNRNYNNICTQ